MRAASGKGEYFAHLLDRLFPVKHRRCGTILQDIAGSASFAGKTLSRQCVIGIDKEAD